MCVYVRGGWGFISLTRRLQGRAWSTGVGGRDFVLGVWMGIDSFGLDKTWGVTC